DELLGAGQIIVDRAKEFRTPYPDGKGSKLFSGLYNDYLTRISNFTRAAEQVGQQAPVMDDGRHFPLWDPYYGDMPGDEVGELDRNLPRNSYSCTWGSYPSVTFPTVSDSLWNRSVGKFDRPVFAALWIDPRIRVSTCYTSHLEPATVENQGG